MGVCCIVFDIDGMLFEFCMHFLNIKKKKVFKISCFLRVSCFFQHSKNLGGGGVLNSGGGGEGMLKYFFFVRRITLSHFTFYAIVNIKKILLKSAPSLNG